IIRLTNRSGSAAADSVPCSWSCARPSRKMVCHWVKASASSAWTLRSVSMISLASDPRLQPYGSRSRGEVDPPAKRGEVGEVGELIAAQEGQDAVRLPLDDAEDQILLGREVMVELRSADAGGLADQLVVGRVVALGPGEADFTVGDRVVVH